LASRHQKGKRPEEISGVASSTYHPPSPHRRWLPHHHHCRKQEHGRCPHQRQLTRLSQRGVRVGDGWVNQLLGELDKRVIPLTMNDVLVPPEDVGAVLMDIHALVGAMTHGEESMKHLQDAGVSSRGGRGTTIVGRVRRGYMQRRRGAVDRKLGKSRAKRLMCHILVEPLMSHRLNHAHDEGSKAT
jgi:hypothetical protein